MNYEKLEEIPTERWDELKPTDVVYVKYPKGKGMEITFVALLDERKKKWRSKNGEDGYKIYNVHVGPALEDIEKEAEDRRAEEYVGPYSEAWDKWDEGEDLSVKEGLLLAEVDEGPYVEQRSFREMFRF